MAQIGSHPRDWLRVQLSGSAPLVTGIELHSSAETLARALDVHRTPPAERCIPPRVAIDVGHQTNTIQKLQESFCRTEDS